MEKSHLKLVPLPEIQDLALEPEAENFLAKWKHQIPLNQHSAEEARQILERIQSESPDLSSLDCESLEVSSGLRGPVPIKIFKPRKSRGKWPVVLYLHGGGWILGNEKIYSRLLRDLCLGAESAVAFVNFNLSPEAKYPVALEQCYSVAQYLSVHGERHQLDSRRLAIAGDGTGANMATVLARWTLERKGPRFACQILFYPITDAAMETESYKLFEHGPWLSKAMMKWSWSAYEPSVEKRFLANLSPLRTELKSLRGLPPALIITGENDMLRDEGEAYAHLLVEAGVSVTAIRVLGTIPDFVMLNALAETEATRNVLDLACARLRTSFSNLNHSS